MNPQVADRIRQTLESVLTQPSPANPDVRLFAQSFRNVQCTIDRGVTDGDKAAFLFEASAIAIQQGRTVTWSGSGIARLNDGAVVEFEIRQDPWAWQIREGNVPQLATDSLAGQWTGEVFGLPFRLALEDAGKEGFTGHVESVDRTLAVTASQSLSWAEISTADMLLRFVGRWVADDILEGHLDQVPEAVRICRVQRRRSCARIAWIQAGDKLVIP